MKTYGPTYDAMPDAVLGPDTGPDVATDSGMDAGACSGITALLAGSTSSLVGASRVGASALKVDVLSGNAGDRIAIAAFGAGFVGVVRAANDAVQSTTFATSWADPVVVASAVARDAPALAVLGVQSAVHLVYQAKSSDVNVDYKFFHGTFMGGNWDAANDPVGGSGPSQSYGPRAPAAAASGTQLMIVQGGDNSVLYDQVWTGTWQMASAHGPIQKTIPPTILALEGGTDDVLVVYPRNGDYKIMSTAHSVSADAGSGWSTAILVDANAFLSGATNEPVSLAPLGNGRAVMVFRGTDSKPYFCLYDPMQGSPWTPPAALVSAANPNVDSLPSVARGVCGADAIAAFVESGAGVKLTSLGGTTWSAPELVPQSSAAKYVAIATHK